MLEAIEARNVIANSHVMRVFFFRWHNSFSLFNFGLRLYHRLFNVQPLIDHCALQFDYAYVEVDEAGTSVFYAKSIVPNVLYHRELVGYYELDLSKFDVDTLQAVDFQLAQDSKANKRLDKFVCFRYAKHWLKTNKSLPFRQSLSVAEGTIERSRFANYFTLPFTCATQVVNVLSRFFPIEPMADNHLPTNVFHLCNVLADNGYGTMFEANDVIM